MADCNKLVKAIRQVSNETTEAQGPVNICYGRVLSSSPLSVLVDQKLTLGAAQLVLTRNVIDYEIQLSMERQEFELEENAQGSNYQVSADRQWVQIHNALVAGEEILLLRQQGGQKYIIIDRVVSV